MIEVKRSDISIEADPKKVIMIFNEFKDPNRYELILQRFLSLSDNDITSGLKYVDQKFSARHYSFSQRLIEHFEQLEYRLGKKIETSDNGKRLLGAYVTKEYSIEGAALFNPSIVPHFDQSEPDKTRFILSFRPVGEKHISSLRFGTGTIDADNVLHISRQNYSTTGKYSFPDPASKEDYDITFGDEVPLEDRVIWPCAPSETKGIEDVRFVRLTDGPARYIGTYTAFDGIHIKSKLLETDDFKHFRIRELKGKAVHDKGMAFFPRKINGRYYIISRQGSESLFIMHSDSLYDWETYHPLQSPESPWEFVQMGNCGSPIETDEGWLLLTHGVGAMREYALGAMLLDLDNPSNVISSLKEPFMRPLENEREGYVPNVLYSCGWMQHNAHIVIPYAMSDAACSFALIETEELIEELKRNCK
ncbi:MAG: glycoside hydrolase family 130 protein [Bacteroidetes bacterium]|nr:glycoside hydrolase family 130 protein [Bacteroidota bacterium]